MKFRIRITALCSLLLGFLSSIHIAMAEAPNVVLIYIDDQDYVHLPEYGGNGYTPSFDRIARSGLKLNRGYVTSSVCVPSRYSLLSGKFAGRCESEHFMAQNPEGVQSSIHFNTTMEEEPQSIAKVLQGAGYATGMVGKWHLGVTNDLWGGYTDEDGNYHRWWPRNDRAPYDSEDAQAAMKRNYPIQQNIVKRAGFDYVDGLYYANPAELGIEPMPHNVEWMTAKAIDFVKECAESETPFFLYYATTIPHYPWTPLPEVDRLMTPAGYLEELPVIDMPDRLTVSDRLSEHGTYRGEFDTDDIYAAWANEQAIHRPWRQTRDFAVYNTWGDDGIGALLDALDMLDLTRKTLVVYMSDNAIVEKGLLYEPGVRVPAAVMWPGQIPQGFEMDDIVANVDWFPTILAACGIEAADYRLDGENLLPRLKGETPELARERLFLEIASSRALVSERFKYIAAMHPDDLNERIANNTIYTPLHGALGALKWFDEAAMQRHPAYWDEEQLYDLINDPGETVNLAKDPDFAQVLETYRTDLVSELATFDRPFGKLVGRASETH